MPGPGSRAKAAKAKKSKQAQALPDAYVSDVDDADGWTAAVNILCVVFELPDMTTRRGLKKIHTNFGAVYAKLDTAYQRNPDNERIRGGIVGIYAKMCVDSLLRNKLMERGLLDKLIPLLNAKSTRFLALRALTLITQHGGESIRLKIALYSPALTKLVDTFPEDPLLCDLVVSVLGHSVGVAVAGDEGCPTYPRILKQLDMSKILGTTVHCMTQPFSDGSSIHHGLELLTNSSLQASQAYKKVPEAVKILVAGMRAPALETRATCLGALMRIYKGDSERELVHFDHRRVMHVVQTTGTPKHLSDACLGYGPTRCEMYMTMQASVEFTRAMTIYPQDRNLYSLGQKLAPLILRTEYAITEGFFQTQNERTGRFEANDLGLPFVRYSDALPLCAKAIRDRGNPAEVDFADVLDIKFKIMRQRLDDATAQARKCLERNPQFAYFYYAIALNADPTDGLRAAKQGMKCKDITPFVMYQLMQRAVEHAGQLGLDKLQEVHFSGESMGKHVREEKLSLGIAFLESAVEDATRFMAEASPDNKYQKNMAYWFTLLTLIMAERASPDLRELKRVFEIQKLSDEFAQLLDLGPPKIVWRLVQEAVRKHFAEATGKYAQLFERAAEALNNPAPPPVEIGKGRDDLAAWLDDLHLDCDDEGCSGSHPHGNLKDHLQYSDVNRGQTVGADSEKYVANPKMSGNMVALHRCSRCGNPSAMLKRCSGCEMARYCDASCQKAHWTEHKNPCKAAQAGSKQVAALQKARSKLSTTQAATIPVPSSASPGTLRLSLPAKAALPIPSMSLEALD